jgi:hypothetical protein
MRHALGQYVELEAAETVSSRTPWGAYWARPSPGTLEDGPDEGNSCSKGSGGDRGDPWDG